MAVTSRDGHRVRTFGIVEQLPAVYERHVELK
jgi:hypothetical protein